MERQYDAKTEPVQKGVASEDATCCVLNVAHNSQVCCSLATAGKRHTRVMLFSIPGAAIINMALCSQVSKIPFHVKLGPLHMIATSNLDSFDMGET